MHHADTYLITLEGWSPVEAGKELVIYVMKNLLDADAKDVRLVMGSGFSSIA